MSRLPHRVLSVLQCVAVCCRCERCLLITESPKTPGHYRYLMRVLGYIPYTGLAVFSFAISRVPVYTAISIFANSYSQRFKVEVAGN